MTKRKPDTMTATKPPEGYPGWLETIIWCQGSSKENRLARAELAQLRAESAAYREAMGALAMIQPNCAGALPRSHAECDLCRLFKRERESGRWHP